MSVQPIPSGHPTVLPHLTVSDAKKAIAFYEQAFGAEVGHVSETPDGKVMHADLRIGNAMIYLNDEFGPPGPAPAGVTLHIWSDDVDALWKRAVAAGAKVLMPLENQFWGDRYGHLEDPLGHRWSLAQHMEDLSPAELEQRRTQAFSDMGA